MSDEGMIEAVMPSGDVPAGAGIVRANVFATLAFAAVSVPLALVDRKALIIVVVIASLVVFAAGIVVFIASFFRAAERSRTEEIGAANLYVLTGPTAPPSIRRVMLGCLVVQVVVAIVVAIIGTNSTAWTNDRVNPMAFATLTPMFGLGMNGLWAAYHGSFGARLPKSKR